MIDERKIEDWLFKVLRDSSWTNYDDIHIDKLLPIEVRSNRKLWISEGLAALKIASDLLAKWSKKDFVCALGISLVDGGGSQKQYLNSVQDLFVRMDHSPPSIYLFNKQWNDWVKTLEISSELKIEEIAERQVRLLEIDRGGEFTSSIFIL